MDEDVVLRYVEFSAAEARNQTMDFLTKKVEEWYELNKGEIFETIRDKAKEGEFLVKLTTEWDTPDQAKVAESFLIQELSVGLGYLMHYDHVKDKEYALILDWSGQA